MTTFFFKGAFRGGGLEIHTKVAIKIISTVPRHVFCPTLIDGSRHAMREQHEKYATIDSGLK